MPEKGINHGKILNQLTILALKKLRLIGITSPNSLGSQSILFTLRHSDVINSRAREISLPKIDTVLMLSMYVLLNFSLKNCKVTKVNQFDAHRNRIMVVTLRVVKEGGGFMNVFGSQPKISKIEFLCTFWAPNRKFSKIDFLCTFWAPNSKTFKVLKLKGQTDSFLKFIFMPNISRPNSQ